jgi:multidrug efflux pump subunit AcrB
MATYNLGRFAHADGPKDIASSVGALLGGTDLDPATYKEGGKSYDIRLRLVKDQRQLPGDLQRIWIRSKNGILLIDLTNQLRAGGMGVHEALVEAGGTRLRPILMTAVSTIAGVLPVAVGIGAGAESRQPLAVAISGGMVSSTFLTLLVVPIIYSYLDQLAHWRWVERFKTRVMARDQEAEA